MALAIPPRVPDYLLTHIQQYGGVHRIAHHLGIDGLDYWAWKYIDQPNRDWENLQTEGDIKEILPHLLTTIRLLK
jgi:hypothetical protein